ncbi:hypothetical protein ATY27_02805 [Rheinheimera sp. F8]|nr:hypothetical protein ATY27_02805 [Rheinheimera sp. F8]
MSEQQSCLQLPQARRHGEGIVVLFRAVATSHETIAGAPVRAIAEWPDAALNFLALESLKLRKSALPAAILLIAAAASLSYMVL